MVFLKTCFECGAKVEKLVDGKCFNCYKQENPPIKEIKPMNFKICNLTKKISYNNHYYTQEELEKQLPIIAKRNTIINDNYTLNNLRVEGFEVDGHKIDFDIVVDCDFKE